MKLVIVFGIVAGAGFIYATFNEMYYRKRRFK